MAAVSHFKPRNTAISPIIREMTRSVAEILGDKKIEPLELQLPYSRPKSSSAHLTPQPTHAPVKSISPSPSTPNYQHATPDKKVLDMLRPFCQPIEDLLPGGKVPPQLAPIVRERRKAHAEQPHSHTCSSPTHPRVHSERTVKTEHLRPALSDGKRRPSGESLLHVDPPSGVSKTKRTKETSKPRRPRFSSVPVPSASSQVDSARDDERDAQSLDKPTRSRKRRETPPTSPTPQKRRRSKRDPSPTAKLHSRPIPKSESALKPKVSRGERRRSERDYAKYGDNDDRRRGNALHLKREQEKHNDDDDDDYENNDDQRRESRDDRDKWNQNHRTESSEKGRDLECRRRRRDGESHQDSERDKGRERNRSRDHSRSREHGDGMDRDWHRNHRQSDRDRNRDSDKVPRRSRPEHDVRDRDDRYPHGEDKLANHNTSSEGSGKQNTASSQQNSWRAPTPLTLSPLTTSKDVLDGQRGANDQATRESCVSQKHPITAKRGRVELTVVKTNKTELQNAFHASKAKCLELYAKKDYDAYEEEARNTFRLGFDFALARETELRLSESEFLKLSWRERNSRRQDILRHYRYLSKSFAQPRIKELEDLDRTSSIAFFRRGVQKVYLRMFAVQRLWDREQLQSVLETERSVASAMNKKRASTTSTDADGADLPLDTLQTLQRLTGEYRNMLQILEYIVKDLGDGHEEAGTECHIQ